MNTPNNDSALRELIGDMVVRILDLTGNPVACGEYVTQQIRELIGVRFVLLAAFDTAGRLQPVSFCPSRKQEIWTNPDFRHLVELAAECDQPAMLRAEKDLIGNILNKLGYRECFVAPLKTGHEKVGLLLLIDLMDPSGMAAILDVLKNISGIVALILRNALLYRNLEDMVVQRTQALTESENKYRSLVENLPGVVYRCDTDAPWSVHHISEGVTALTGRPPEEFLSGKTQWADIIHPDDLPMVDDKVRSGIENDMPYQIEYRILRTDGSVSWVSERGKCIRPGDDVRYLDGVILDINDRKKAEQEMYQWAQLFHTADFALFVSNPEDNTFLEVNPAASRERGYAPEELAGQSVLSLYPPDMHEDLLRRFQGYQNIDHDVFESIHVRKDGSSFPVLVEITVIRDRTGKPLVRMAYALDLTERRKSEEERERLQKQLIQSQKMEAIGILAGGVAHDFNNILQGIIVNLDLLKLKYPYADLKTSVDDVMTLAFKAAELTKGMLAYSRQQIFTLKSVNVNEVVKGATKLLSRMLGEDIEVSERYTEKNLTARLDSSQIQQVILNLAANARDAMPHGGVLHIETAYVELSSGQAAEYGMEQPGGYAVISVTDSGSGIARKDLAHIFDPFYTTKEVGRGTGLGLAIVFGVVKQHAGTITVYSEEGKGTTFRIYLPLHAGDTVTAELPTESKAMEGGRGRIMLVEDDILVNTSMQKLLTAIGYQVVAFVRPEEALAEYARTSATIDLVILDVIMPNISGKEVFTEMQRIRPGIKALFISGYPADFLDKKGLLEGSFSLLMKPVMPQALAEKIKSILGV